MKRRTDRLDFVHPLIEARDSGAISTDEIEQQASILILAGGETTSIALTSATFLLLQNPDKMENLTKELQTHFQHESEIDVSSIKKLVYLQAVIQETLRMFPPITNGFPRQTIIGGVQIDGHVVPDQVGLNISTRLISIYADRYRLL
jgi:cytochrome P450